MATLKTHSPSGQAPWPLILLTGDTGSGRSWSAAEFTGSDRIGRAFWMDLGEACAEEYGTVPGADYEVVDHNGTWIDIIEQAEAVRDVAKAHAATNKPPVLFVIDSMTHEWAMLSSWADKRARRQKGNKAKLADDADAEVDITMNLWNDANSRHNRLMNILKTFPGVVVMIADEKEIAQLDKGGNPIAGKKEWKPEGHKFLGRDARVWIRMFRDDVPQVVKCRSVKYGIRPGVDKPKRLPDFSFEWLVFELLGCDPATTKSAPDRTLDADQLLPEECTGPDAPPLVDEPRLRKAIEFILNSKDLATAEVRKTWAADGNAGVMVVGELVPAADVEALGLEPDRDITLNYLADKNVAFWRKHKCSPRALPDAA